MLVKTSEVCIVHAAAGQDLIANLTSLREMGDNFAGFLSPK